MPIRIFFDIFVKWQKFMLIKPSTLRFYWYCTATWLISYKIEVFRWAVYDEVVHLKLHAIITSNDMKLSFKCLYCLSNYTMGRYITLPMIWAVSLASWNRALHKQWHALRGCQWWLIISAFVYWIGALSLSDENVSRLHLWNIEVWFVEVAS